MRIVCVDFDGTLADYTRWEGPHSVGAPKPGAREFIHGLCDRGYRVVVFTARANSTEGHCAVSEWLRSYGFPVLEVTSIKPPALLYIDDRAFRFRGDYGEVIQFLDEYREPE